MDSELTAEEIFALFCVRGWSSEEVKDQHIPKIQKRLNGGWHVDWELGRWDRKGARFDIWERKVP